VVANLGFTLRLTPKLTLAFVLFATISVVSVGTFAYIFGRHALRNATAANVTSIAIEKEDSLESWREERLTEITKAAMILGDSGVFEVFVRDSNSSVDHVRNPKLTSELEHMRGQHFLSLRTGWPDLR